MATFDEEMLKTLQDLSAAMNNISDRLNEQTRTLAELKKVKAQAQPQEPVDPDYLARATAHAVRQSLAPEVSKIVDAMQEFNGTKAMLRERWRVVDREEARLGRWLFLPLTVTVGIPLALGLVLALTMPKAVSQTSLTCHTSGGIWLVPTESRPAACLFEAGEPEPLSGS